MSDIHPRTFYLGLTVKVGVKLGVSARVGLRIGQIKLNNFAKTSGFI